MTQRSIASFFKPSGGDTAKRAPDEDETPRKKLKPAPSPVTAQKEAQPASPAKKATSPVKPASPAKAAKEAPSPARAAKEAPSPAEAAKEAPSPAEAAKEAPSPAEAAKDAPAPEAKAANAGPPKRPTGEQLRSPDYKPEEFAHAAPAMFGLLADAFSAIESLKYSGKGSKKVSTTILTNVYRTLFLGCPADLVPALYLSVNKLAPDYENVESGIGDHVLVKTICEVYGRSEKQIKESMMNEEASDLGEVAMQSRVAQKMLWKPKPLVLQKVFAEMRSMADQKGTSSMTKRKDIIKRLLVAAQGDEAKFIVRSLQGKMRIGVQKQTVLQALAHAFVLTPAPPRKRCSKAKEEEEFLAMEHAVKQAFSSLPSYNKVAEALCSGASPDELVEKCALEPGIPVAPMLAKPTKGVTEILDRFQNIPFTAEFKYDGERAQVHICGDRLETYSRNSENTTSKYPDVVEIVRAAMKPGVESCIIDAEVVAFDQTTKKILPFQTLTTRKRKDASIDDIKVHVCVFVFDMIFKNGESLCRLPFRERRAHLHSSLNPIDEKLCFAMHKDLDNQEDMEVFLQEAIDGACEGLMLKTLNDPYEPSRRSLNWLKLKKDYLEGLGDSVDLVVLGAFYGKGKRAGLFGAYLLGVYDPEDEVYQSCCKAGTGFSDQDLKTHHEFFQPHVREEMPCEYEVNERMAPDVWFDPVQVWECKCADLQISPIHTAAMGAKADGKGIGLRFPRFLHIRTDKKPEDATTAQQIVEMFEQQAAQQNAAGAEEDDD